MNNPEQTIKKSALAPTVLVSGGAGFIGSHVIEALLLKDAKVVVLDDFSTGKKAYLSSVMSNPKFTLIEYDINNGIPKNIESVDYIIHLAGVESYVFGEKKVSLESLLTNAIGTKNLLDLAQRSYSKFLLVSSLDVYGGRISSHDLAHYFGQNEADEKKYSHSEAKRFAEALVWEYYKKHKINVRILRLPEVFGPRMDFSSGGELGRLIKLMLDHQDLTVFGEGLEKNYYLYVSDAVSGVMKAEFSDDTDGKIFTLSNAEPVTTLEVTYLLKGLANKETKVVFKNPVYDQQGTTLRIPEADSAKELRWSPKTDLKDGLIKTLKWYNYEFNTSHFKPNKIIKDSKEAKEKEDMIAGITTIKPLSTEEHAAEPASKWPQISKVYQFAQQTPASAPSATHVAAPMLAPAAPDVKKEEPKPMPSPKSISSIMPTQPQAPKESPKPTGKTQLINKKFVLAANALAIVAALVFFAVLPVIEITYFSSLAWKDFNGSLSSLEKLNMVKAEEQAKLASENFANAKRRLSDVGWVFVLGKQEDRLTTYAKVLRAAEFIANSGAHAAVGLKPVNDLWANIKPDSQTGINKDELANASRELKASREDVLRAQAELSSANTSLLPNEFKTTIEERSKDLETAEKSLKTAEVVLNALPDLIGAEGEKKYLILFQNPNELRPTGGFIGSYAITTFENGKIKEITIDDIYNPDGLLDLNGDKTPSYDPIKKYAKTEFLRIRDSNWNPSFPESAETALDLFFKAGGHKFNGVITVDIYMVQNLLRATGPLFLTAYNEEITADNVYERSQYYSEVLYTDGSQQKKAFLTVLGNKLLESLFSLSAEKLTAVGKEAYKGLEERHVLVYVPRSPITSLLSELSWDGRVSETRGDYVYIVDANVGVNKANYFVKQSAKYELQNTYRDGSLEVKLTINYEHTGADNTWPGGVYMDYLRVYTPKDSFLHKAKVLSEQTAVGDEGEIASETEASGTTPDVTKEVVISEDLDKRVFSLPFELKPGEKKSIVFNYTLPSSISIGRGEDFYGLTWQKQPGTDAMPIEIVFNKPFGKEVVSTTPLFKAEGDVYRFSTGLSKDFKAVLKLK